MAKDIETSAPAPRRTRRGFLDAVTLKVEEGPASLRVSLGLPSGTRRHTVTMDAAREDGRPRTLAFTGGDGGSRRDIDLLDGLAAFGMAAPGDMTNEGGRTRDLVAAAYASYLGRGITDGEGRDVAAMVSLATRGLGGGPASWVDPAAIALLAHGTDRTPEAYAALTAPGATGLRAAVARYPMLASGLVASDRLPGGDEPVGAVAAMLWEGGLGGDTPHALPPLEFHVIGWLEGLRIDCPGWTAGTVVPGLALANALPRRVLPRTRQDFAPFLLAASHADRIVGKARGRGRSRAWEAVSARVSGLVEAGGWHEACRGLASDLA